MVDAKKRFWCLNCLAMYEFEQALMLHGSFACNRQPVGIAARPAVCPQRVMLHAPVRRAPCGSISHEPKQSLMGTWLAASLPRCLQVHTLSIPTAPSQPWRVLARASPCGPCVHRRTLIPVHRGCGLPWHRP